MCPCGCIGKRKEGSYVEKTLNGGAGLLRQVMFQRRRRRPGRPPQHLDPRVKFVSMLPTMLSVVTHGHVVVTLWHWHGHPEGFTSQGLTSAAW
jgi:cobalt/nickel transport system permease protein